MSSTTIRRPAATALAALALAGLAACGGGGTGTATAPADDPGVEFARCLRENGVDVADPAPGQPVVIDGSVDQDALAAAQEACADLAPGAGDGAAGTVPLPDLDALVALAQCMRSRGFDVPDPQQGPGGQVTQPLGSDLDLGDPELVEAREECATEVGITLPGMQP